MQRVALPFLFSLVLSSCSSGPQPKTSSHAFSISSAEGGFVIRGSLRGSYEYTDKQFHVKVDGGRIVSRSEDLNDVHLQPLIAGPGTKDARRVAEGVGKTIGDFKKLVPRELTKALNFTFTLPRDFDPDSQWLVFQFVQENGQFSVICDTHNLSETNPAAKALRPGSVCWGTPD